MAEVRIEARATRTTGLGGSRGRQEVEVSVELPAAPSDSNRLAGLAVFADGLLESAARSAGTDGAKAHELAEAFEARCDDLEARLAGVSDWLHKVEKDLDSRADYALRQLAAIDAPHGDDLVEIERAQCIKASVLQQLKPRGGLAGRRLTTGALARRTGWAEELIGQACAALHTSGEVERTVAHGLPLWALPDNTVSTGPEEV